MSVNAKGVSPEVVAVIMAAVQQMMGSGFQAVTVRRASEVWTIAGRQNA